MTPKSRKMTDARKDWTLGCGRPPEPRHWKLVEQYLPLVHKVAGQIAAKGPVTVEAEDLAGYGVFGLLDAAVKYDKTRGATFVTYAVWRIRGEIMDAIREQKWLPRQLQDKINCGEMSKDEKRFMVSLEAFDERRGCPSEIFGEANAGLKQVEDSDQVRRLVRGLQTEDRIVIELYFFEGWTMKRIGRSLDASESRVCQIKARALRSLRGAAGVLGLEETCLKERVSA